LSPEKFENRPNGRMAALHPGMKARGLYVAPDELEEPRRASPLAIPRRYPAPPEEVLRRIQTQPK